MSLVRWDPFADMAKLRDQVDRLFAQSLTRTGHEPASTRTWAPNVDIVETEHALILHAELPGMKPEEIAIQMEGDTLTIKGERKFEHEEKRKQFVRIERAYGTFQRSFTLGIPVKSQDIHAMYRNGVLEITLPKAEEVKPKQIQIQVEEAVEAG